MKQVTLIRDRLIRHCHELRIQISMLPELEPDALLALGGIPYTYPENLAATVDVILRALGHEEGKPKEARFDKTRRAVAKAPPPGPKAQAREVARAKQLEVARG